MAEETQEFNFGDTPAEQADLAVPRLEYPLDPESMGAIKRSLNTMLNDLSRPFLPTRPGNSPDFQIAPEIGFSRTVSGTITETNLLSMSIPGGTLGLAGGIAIHATVNSLRNINGETVTLNVRYGSGVVSSNALSLIGSGTSSPYAGPLNIVILSNGSLNSQRIGIAGSYVEQAATPAVRGHYGSGTIAIDSSISQTLTLSVTWSANTASNTITVDGAVLFS